MRGENLQYLIKLQSFQGEKWRTWWLKGSCRFPGELEQQFRDFSNFRDLERKSFVFNWQNIQVNQDVNGRTLLHYAADYGQSEVVNYLVSKGADVNVSLRKIENNRRKNWKLFSFSQALDKHGISPLLAAIWEGHVNCVKILLQNVSIN